MTNLTQEEKAIITMYDFQTKEELIKMLEESLLEITENDMQEIIKILINKIENYTAEELKKVENIFE